MGALPEEVLERLSAQSCVRVTSGPEDGPRTLRVDAAPVQADLYLLVEPDSPLLTDLEHSTAVVVAADGPDESWQVRVRGRAVPGRRVVAERRRAELVHWLPEGVGPTERVAVRVWADHLDYATGKGATRKRAEGPVPGGETAGPIRRWADLVLHDHWGWLVAMLALQYGGILVLTEPGDGRVVRLVVMALAGAALLGSVVLFEQRARFVRWREGLVREDHAGPLLRGTVAPEPVRRVSLALGVFGALAALLFGLAAGPAQAALLLLTSGAPLLAPFYGIRYVLRRNDARAEA